ncbi:nucleoside phosphorylase domain-containing protein [Aspergillus falconensis]
MAAAARAMLDQTHPLPQGFTDPNAYKLGELNGHHIVLAYLPSGVYGTTSAAVVSRMHRTFPQLQFGLMVGIGGGLGVKHGGGGKFEQIGVFNQPPQALLMWLNQLKANQMTCRNGSLSEIPQDKKGPSIHYGLIASGNQVMKDAETQDCLACEQGILYFGMEVAGIMNELPTLVIRGICDYCDSHK